MSDAPTATKAQVKSHWESETCGTRYGAGTSRAAYFAEIARKRYEFEPYILDFANFRHSSGKRVLEIGVGAGSDFSQWVLHGARATGVDLTQAAIELTRERLQLSGVEPGDYDLKVADAENLPFPDGQFDLVYSYGVLHHTPNTQRAFAEVLRVLRPGGSVKAMVYHVPSWTGLMLWIKDCLLRGKPFCSAKEAIYAGLESPGTKAYTLDEARKLVEGAGFEGIQLSTRLGPGDLLTIEPSSRYQSPLYRALWKLYPRWLVRLLGDRFGLFLLIEAQKPHTESLGHRAVA